MFFFSIKLSILNLLLTIFTAIEQLCNSMYDDNSLSFPYFNRFACLQFFFINKVVYCSRLIQLYAS